MEFNIRTQYPLALQSSKVPLVLQNPLSSLVTCLPYIDGEEDDYIREMVGSLIQREMRNMPAKNYLETLPMPDLRAFESSLMKEEFDKIRTNRRTLGYDLSRYELKDGPVSEKKKDPNSWREAIDYNHMTIQHNNLKMFNLELAQKFGPQVWKDFIVEADENKKKLKGMIEGKKEEINELNGKRKFNQSNMKIELDAMNNKIELMINKNQTLEGECSRLQTDILKLGRKQKKLM